jgi:hypothetical protein
VIYQERMQLPDWPIKRGLRLDIDEHECRLCGSTENLQVHHKPRSYADMPNENVQRDLTTLCEACHDVITDRIRKVRYATRKPLVLEPHISSTRNISNEQQLANIEVSPHRGMPHYLPQRATLQPDEPILQSHQKNLRQEKEN